MSPQTNFIVSSDSSVYIPIQYSVLVSPLSSRVLPWGELPSAFYSRPTFLLSSCFSTILPFRFYSVCFTPSHFQLISQLPKANRSLPLNVLSIPSFFFVPLSPFYRVSVSFAPIRTTASRRSCVFFNQEMIYLSHVIKIMLVDTRLKYLHY